LNIGIWHESLRGSTCSRFFSEEAKVPKRESLAVFLKI
jgi:hypothetical protein